MKTNIKYYLLILLSTTLFLLLQVQIFQLQSVSALADNHYRACWNLTFDEDGLFCGGNVSAYQLYQLYLNKTRYFLSISNKKSLSKTAKMFSKVQE